MKLRTFALLGLFAPLVVHARTPGTVQGTVTDAGNGQPLASAQVRSEGTVRGALSEAAGRYTIPGAPTGRRVVIARRIGYAEARREVDVSSSAAAPAGFSVTPS